MPSMEAVPKLLIQPAPQVIDSGRPSCQRDAVRKVHDFRTRAVQDYWCKRLFSTVEIACAYSVHDRRRYRMNATLFKALVALLPACLLFSVRPSCSFRERPEFYSCNSSERGA